MSSKAIATSTFWQLASQVTMAALSIVTVKFVAIGLSKELAGFYNSAYGYLQLFGILADFGLYAVAVREVSKAKDKERVLGALLVLRIIILLLSLGTALLFVHLLPAWQDTPLPRGVLIASLVPFFTLLAGVVRTVFQVTYKMHYVFIAEVTQRIITVSLIGYYIYVGFRNTEYLYVYEMFLFIGGIGAAVLFLLSVWFGNKLIPIRMNFDRALLKSIFWKAAPFGVAYLCMALYRQLDVTLIALLRDDFELQNAYYGFVLRMTDMGFLIPTFLLNSTLPILSERTARGEDTKSLLGKTFLIILILGTVSGLFAALWPRPLMHLLTTESYLSTAGNAGSDTALFLVSAPLFLNGFVLFSFYVLLNKHAWKQLVASLSLGALAALILNVMLIPDYGFVGAAYTSIIVHVVLVALLLPQALKIMPIAFTTRQFLQWGTFSLVTLAALYLFRPVIKDDLGTVIGLVAMSALMMAIGWGVGLKDLISPEKAEG